MGFFAYNKLQKNAYCVLSDSGSVPEESAILHFPAVQVRVSSERPEAYDKGVLTLTGFDKSAIVTAIEIARDPLHMKANLLPDEYRDLHVSLKVLKLVHGLTSIRKAQRI
jgi:UDP-N-acetylglucosamine 2-epimerase (non-hydrolysing)